MQAIVVQRYPEIDYSLSTEMSKLANRLLHNEYQGIFHHRRPYSGLCMKPTTHVHLLPILRMSGVKPHLRHMHIWGAQGFQLLVL
jgi:hypothetical protein